jgi:hypothetical protein
MAAVIDCPRNPAYHGLLPSKMETRSGFKHDKPVPRIGWKIPKGERFVAMGVFLQDLEERVEEVCPDEHIALYKLMRRKSSDIHAFGSKAWKIYLASLKSKKISPHGRKIPMNVPPFSSVLRFKNKRRCN